MEKKKNAVVVGGTKNMSFAIAVLLLSLIESNPDFCADVIVFHDGIEMDEQKNLDRIYPCIFKEYQFPFAENINWKSGMIERFTKMVFSKYECLRLLDYYRAVVWLDYDMLVVNTIGELFEPVDGGLRLMMTQTLADCIKAEINQDELIEFAGSVGVHSSVMAFYDTLPNYMDLYQWCLITTEKYADILGLPEQAIFSLMVHKYNIPVYPLPFQLYSPHPVLHKGTLWDCYVKIWHTYGKEKYWDGIDDEHWNQLYDQYQNMKRMELTDE